MIVFARAGANMARDWQVEEVKHLPPFLTPYPKPVRRLFLMAGFLRAIGHGIVYNRIITD